MYVAPIFPTYQVDFGIHHNRFTSNILVQHRKQPLKNCPLVGIFRK